MAESSPKFGLTRTRRGWVKRIAKGEKSKWICSDKVAPTGEAADAHFQANFADLAEKGNAPAAPNPPEKPDPMAAPVDELFEYVLTRWKRRIGLDVRGIKQETFDEYEDALASFTNHSPAPGRVIGRLPYRELGPDDFASHQRSLADRLGVDRLKKYTIVVRSAFKALAKPPVRLPLPDYGDGFHLPTRRDVRLSRKRHKEEHGPKLFEAAEIAAQVCGRWRTDAELAVERDRRARGGRGLAKHVRGLIPGANRASRAMILLAINCGFANTDLAELPLTVVRLALKSGWIDYERPKTGARRLAKLWPETVHALERYLRFRPVPEDRAAHGDLCFVTPTGLPYIVGKKDQVSFGMMRLLRRLGQHVDERDRRRLGRNFQSLRRTYRSVAAEVGKELVIDLSMGHADDADDMGKVYTTAELRGELEKVSDHVRSFLLAGSRTVRRRPATAPGPSAAGDAGAAAA